MFFHLQHACVQFVAVQLDMSLQSLDMYFCSPFSHVLLESLFSVDTNVQAVGGRVAPCFPGDRNLAHPTHP